MWGCWHVTAGPVRQPSSLDPHASAAQCGRQLPLIHLQHCSGARAPCFMLLFWKHLFAPLNLKLMVVWSVFQRHVRTRLDVLKPCTKETLSKKQHQKKGLPWPQSCTCERLKSSSVDLIGDMDTPLFFSFFQFCCLGLVTGGHCTCWRCCGSSRPLGGAWCFVVENRTSKTNRKNKSCRR